MHTLPKTIRTITKVPTSGSSHPVVQPTTPFFTELGTATSIQKAMLETTKSPTSTVAAEILVLVTSTTLLPRETVSVVSMLPSISSTVISEKPLITTLEYTIISLIITNLSSVTSILALTSSASLSYSITPPFPVRTAQLRSSPSPGPPAFCISNCQINVGATRLGYPGQVFVTTTTNPVLTLNNYTDRAGRDVSSSLRSVPVDVGTPTTLTWQFFGVPLTWPTAYAAYATFSHISFQPIGSACVSESSTLTLTSPTNYEPLIIIENEIPNPDFVAPTVVPYLNSLPTVLVN